MASIQALIIEDTAINSDVLCEMLRGEGLTCVVLQDARMIQRYMAEQTPPDLIFLDLEMPYIDGYEVLDILKNQAGWETVPVVACTVHTGEANTARSKPFHSFLSKPLDADHFSEQLKEILDGKRVWDVSRMA